MPKKKTKKSSKAPSPKKKPSKSPARRPVKDVYDRVEQDLDQSKRGGSSDFWKIPDGKSIIRVVPFMHDKEPFVFVEDLRYHINDGDNYMSLLHGGDDCPVQALREELEADVWKDIRARKRFLCNVVVVKDPDGTEDEHRIATLPVKVMQYLSEYIGGKLKRLAPKALDMKKGRNFKVSRSGKMFKTKYDVDVESRATPCKVEVEAHDLIERLGTPDMVKLEAYAEQLREKHLE